MAKVLGIDDFFYVPDRCYDSLAERALPHYHEVQEIIVSILHPDRNSKIDVIDLGVGTGVTAAYILRNFPNATVRGVDLFDQMLNDARVRLAPFVDRINLVRGDNAEFLQGAAGTADAIVSAFCIHHQDQKGKESLFSLVAKALRPGGRFVMADLTKFDDPATGRWAHDRILGHLYSQIPDEGYRAKWKEHWETINTPSGVEEMSRWLESAGLEPEVAFRDGEIAVMIGLKR